MTDSTYNGHGLKPLPPDERDFKFGALYVLPKLSELPSEFTLMYPLAIKDQGETDYCTAFATTSVSEDQEGIILDPLYQFYRTKQIDGDPTGFGSDIRSAAKAITKYGSLEAKLAPYTITDPRDEIVAGTRYTDAETGLALQHRKSSYLFVSGPYDVFDNIRATIWKNRAFNESVVTGVNWCQEWTNAPGGVINAQGTPINGHAIKIFGWKLINGEPYLMAQLSNGQTIGDRGIFYFSRAIINQDFHFGALTFSDLPVETAKYYNDNKVKADMNWLIQILQAILNLLKKKHQ